MIHIDDVTDVLYETINKKMSLVKCDIAATQTSMIMSLHDNGLSQLPKTKISIFSSQVIDRVTSIKFYTTIPVRDIQIVVEGPFVEHKTCFLNQSDHRHYYWTIVIG